MLRRVALGTQKQIATAGATTAAVTEKVSTSPRSAKF